MCAVEPVRELTRKRSRHLPILIALLGVVVACGSSPDEACGGFEPLLVEALDAVPDDPILGQGERRSSFRPGDNFNSGGSVAPGATCESVSVGHIGPVAVSDGDYLIDVGSGRLLESITLSRFSSSEKLDSIPFSKFRANHWSGRYESEFGSYREKVTAFDDRGRALRDSFEQSQVAEVFGYIDVKVECLFVSVAWELPLDASMDGHLERRDAVVQMVSGVVDQVCDE